MGEIERSVKRQRPSTATLVVGTQAANVINVAVQFQSEDSGVAEDVTERVAVQWYLSDDADGDSLAGTAPSVGISIGTDGLLIEHIANKAGAMVSEADGDCDIDIEEASVDTWYLVLVMPDGSLVVSGAITFA